MVVSSYRHEGVRVHNCPYYDESVLTSLITWNLGWQIWASWEVMLRWVSLTPLGTPVVPLLYGSTNTDSRPGARLGSRLSPLEVRMSLYLRNLESLCSPTTMTFTLSSAEASFTLSRRRLEVMMNLASLLTSWPLISPVSQIFPKYFQRSTLSSLLT